MTQEDRAYLLKRVETERRRSLEATTPKAAEAHAALADAYETRLGAEPQQPEV